MSKQAPNIIFIITDQQRFDTIAALGFPHMDTPHLDRLVREGTHFTQCHVAGASCVPARASLFTGLYPHTTGILKNADMWRHSWVEDLAAAGYRCVNVGKMHTWPMNTPCGFHERYNVENKDRFLEARYYFDEWDKALAARGLVKQQRSLYRQRSDYAQSLGAFDWELPEDMHADNFVGNTACWWLENYPKTEPLFLQVGFVGPHPPYDPPARYTRAYMERDIPITMASEEEIAGHPPPLQAMRVHNSEVDHDSLVFQMAPTREALKRQRAHYLGNVTLIDEQVGNILAKLSAKGYLDNAIVVFTSDHGDCMGEHGHSQKWTMFDQVLRVPMIVWAPGRVVAGGRSDALVQQMDLVPFLLAQAGASTRTPMEAQTLEAALRGEPFEGRSAVYAEQMRDLILTEAEFVSCIRTRQWKLVHFLGESFGQLYDLAADPGETRNLWEDARAAPAKQQLLHQLLEWRVASQHHTRNLMEAHR